MEDKITFKPTDENFVIGGKDFEEEGCNIYRIYLNDKEIGIMALKEYSDGISLDGLEIGEPYRNKGYGKKVVDILKKKYKNIYVRAIPSAKEFWKKQGHKAHWNNDSGTYDGHLINESASDKILYIVRGIPGSGKSTLANKLTSNVVEADQFMYEDGEYKWKPEKLHMAHKKCQETVEQYMQEGRDKIAVANTFIKLKEIKPYIDLAKQYDYKIVVKECDGGFQSVHNVPEETLEKMKSKFQPYKDEEMNESKQLTESILYDDLAYNDWNEKYEQLTVIANPSIEWLRNQLNSDDCYGFRFLHNTERNKLYVWDCNQPWMHQQVFDMVDMDWGKPGTNVVGIFEPNCVAVWEELAEDGEAESSIALAKKLDGKLFKELYPNGYQMTTCC